VPSQSQLDKYKGKKTQMLKQKFLYQPLFAKKKQKENLKKNVKEQKLWDSEPAIMTKVAN
jgi:hypothetical protein